MCFIESIKTGADYIIPAEGNAFHMIFSRTGKTFLYNLETSSIKLIQEQGDFVPYYRDILREIIAGRGYRSKNDSISFTTPFEYEEPSFDVDKTSFVHTYEQLPFFVNIETWLYTYNNVFVPIATPYPGCFKFEASDHFLKTCHRENGLKTCIWDIRFVKSAIKIFDGIGHIFHHHLFFDGMYVPLHNLDATIPIQKGNQIGIRHTGIDIFDTSTQTRYEWK